MPKPNFDSLNNKIHKAGADWVAGDTPYSHLYGTTSSTKSMGLALSPEAAFAELQTSRGADQNIMFGAPPPALPSKIDWRSDNGKNWVTPVRDQATCGSCVAFATVATFESRMLIQENKPGIDFDLSEAHLFFCGTPNACALGWQPQAALNFAQNAGIGREASFPYTPGNQPCRNVTSVVHGGNPSTAGLTLARKQALQNGPVIGCMAVFGDFFSYQSGIYRHVAGNHSGYHAVCVVGYDDGTGCWIAKNSWGQQWGEQGFFRIRYGECGMDTQFPFYYPASVTLVQGTTIP